MHDREPDQQDELLVLGAADEGVDQGPLQQIADAEKHGCDRQQRDQRIEMQDLEQDESGIHRHHGRIRHARS